MSRSEKKWRAAWLALSVWALAWSGCASSNGGDDSLLKLGIDDGASKGESKSALVTADQDVTIKLNTGARLTIPAGAVDDDVEVVMKRPADRDALPLLKKVPAQYKVLSAPYVVTPHGKSFNRDLELSLPVAKGGNGGQVAVARLADESDTNWKIQGPASVEDEAAKISVRHFSVYVLLELPDDAELDAGIEDASDTLDADAVPEASDALEASDDSDGAASSDASANLEAATVADASTNADASDAFVTTGTFADRLVARLTQCNLVAQSGLYTSTWAPLNDTERCEVNCLLDAACADLESDLCTQTEPTAAYLTCFKTCASYAVVQCLTTRGVTDVVASCDGVAECMDGSDEDKCPAAAFLTCTAVGGKPVPVAAKCDGAADCSDASDEEGCPAGTHFVCKSGELISAHYECDGDSDCLDASDEANCVPFDCKDGAQQVPRNVVCDLTRNCSDGSDEDQGCLKPTCDVDNAPGSGKGPVTVDP